MVIILVFENFYIQGLICTYNNRISQQKNENINNLRSWGPIAQIWKCVQNGKLPMKQLILLFCRYFCVNLHTKTLLLIAMEYDCQNNVHRDSVTYPSLIMYCLVIQSHQSLPFFFHRLGGLFCK